MIDKKTRKVNVIDWENYKEYENPFYDLLTFLLHFMMLRSKPTVKIFQDSLELKCWGYNYYGQLGLEINNDEVKDVPNNLDPVDLGSNITCIECPEYITVSNNGDDFYCEISITEPCNSIYQAIELTDTYVNNIILCI